MKLFFKTIGWLLLGAGAPAFAVWGQPPEPPPYVCIASIVHDYHAAHGGRRVDSLVEVNRLHIFNAVVRFYKLIDQADITEDSQKRDLVLAAALQIVSEDIVYRRDRLQELSEAFVRPRRGRSAAEYHGMSAFIHFYTVDRQIRGEHSLHTVKWGRGNREIKVTGTFTGVQLVEGSNPVPLKLGFSDTWEFEPESGFAIKRVSKISRQTP